MSMAVLMLRLALAAVFVVAGLAKLFDRKGTAASITGFGVPQTMAPALALLLPLAELIVAALLVFAGTVMVGCLAAAALLGVFMAAIITALARGRAPDCHCFGQLHSKPVGRSTLILNAGLLTGVAIIAAAGRDHPPLSASSLFAGTPGLGLALNAATLGLALLEGWALLHVFRQNGRLLLRLDELELRAKNLSSPAPDAPRIGLPVGAAAPDFVLPALAGPRDISLRKLLARSKPLVLIFMDTKCSPCMKLLPKILEWQALYSEKLTIAVISRGALAENQSKFKESGLQFVLLQKDRVVSDAYQLAATPSAVHITADGKIAADGVSGEQGIAGLVQAAARPKTSLSLNGLPAFAPGPVKPPPTRPGLPIGVRAPVLRLPDLDGTMHDIAAPFRLPTLLVFWNPACGYCVKLAPELKKFELDAALDPRVRIVLISTGDVQANRDLGIESLILLDPSLASSRSFQITGTPSAVLLDEDAKIASDIAVGGGAIMSLLKSQRIGAANL